MVWPFKGKKRGRHEEVITDGLRSDGIPVDVMTEDDVRRTTFRSKSNGRYYLAKDVDQFMDRVIESISWYRGHAGHDLIKSAGSELVDDRPVIMNEPPVNDRIDVIDDVPRPEELPEDLNDEDNDKFKPSPVDTSTIPVPPANVVDGPVAPINPFTGLPLNQ